jgi:hypothetical protein
MLINKKNQREKIMKSDQHKELKAKLVIYTKVGAYLGVIAVVMSGHSALAADWFKVEEIKDGMISPLYKLVNDNIGKLAIAVGLGTTFLARGGDMWQKGMAFGLGSLGTAGAIKLSQIVIPVA